MQEAFPKAEEGQLYKEQRPLLRPMGGPQGPSEMRQALPPSPFYGPLRVLSLSAFNICLQSSRGALPPRTADVYLPSQLLHSRPCFLQLTTAVTCCATHWHVCLDFCLLDLPYGLQQ